MLRRWWRRRSARDPEPDPAPGAEPAPGPGGPAAPGGVSDDGAPPRGALVRAGEMVELRRHVPGNREAFQRWYADAEIAGLLRHDQEPLDANQSRNYFDTFVLPLSARGACWAIHERPAGRLLGTTAITDITTRRGIGRSALFRIVIGEKDAWGRGFGTEATRLVMDEAFDEMDLDEVRLEVFKHNPRAIAAYRRVGFEEIGEHVEWVSRRRTELRVVEMALPAETFWYLHDDGDDDDEDDEDEDEGSEDEADDGTPDGVVAGEHRHAPGPPDGPADADAAGPEQRGGELAPTPPGVEHGPG